MANKTLQVNIAVNTAVDNEESVYGLVLAIINEANNYGYPVSSVFLDNDTVLDGSRLKKIDFSKINWQIMICGGILYDF